MRFLKWGVLAFDYLFWGGANLPPNFCSICIWGGASWVVSQRGTAGARTPDRAAFSACTYRWTIFCALLEWAEYFRVVRHNWSGAYWPSTTSSGVGVFSFLTAESAKDRVMFFSSGSPSAGLQAGRHPLWSGNNGDTDSGNWSGRCLRHR